MIPSHHILSVEWWGCSVSLGHEEINQAHHAARPAKCYIEVLCDIDYVTKHGAWWFGHLTIRRVQEQRVNKVQDRKSEKKRFQNNELLAAPSQSQFLPREAEGDQEEREC